MAGPVAEIEPSSPGLSGCRLPGPGRLFALALGVRLLLWLVLTLQGASRLEPDSHDYLALARNLRRGAFARDAAGAVPDIKRTPGFPLFLATFGPERPHLAALALALISAGTPLLVLQLARELELSETAGRGAALVLALDPLSIVSGQLILTEALFTLQVLLAVIGLAALLARLRRREGLPFTLVLATSAAIAIATLTRPNGLLLWPLLGLLVLETGRRFGGRAFALALLAVALGTAPVGAWLIRNRIVSGGWVLTTIGATNVLEYRGAAADASGRGLSWLERREQLRRQYGDDDRRRPPVAARELAGRKMRAGLELMARNKLAVAKQTGRALVVMGLLPGAGAVTRATGIHEGGTGLYGALVQLDTAAIQRALDRLGGSLWGILAVVLVTGVAHGLVLLLVGYGLPQSARSPAGLAMILVIATLLLPASGPEAEPRFRVPAMPFVAILAGIGLARAGRSRALPSGSERATSDPAGGA